MYLYEATDIMGNNSYGFLFQDDYITAVEEMETLQTFELDKFTLHNVTCESLNLTKEQYIKAKTLLLDEDDRKADKEEE